MRNTAAFRRLPAAAITGLLLGTALLSGCVSSPTAGPKVASASDAPSASASAAASAAAGLSEADGTKYAACMREHGIDLPDPASNGGLIPIVSGSGPMAAANAACSSLLPVTAPVPAFNAQESAAVGLAIAKCMRASGFPDFPDPSTNADDPGQGIPADTANDPTFGTKLSECAKSAGVGDGKTITVKGGNSNG